MRKRTRALVVLVSIGLAAVAVSGQVPAPPPWAYGFTAPGPEPGAPPCARDSRPLDCARVQAPRPAGSHALSGSTQTFTETQIHYDYGPADWFPEDHPAMPEIVARGRQSDTLRACALCHYPNGHGKPENASPAGLPAAYVLQQLHAFRDGTRKSGDPRKANANEMIQIARYMTEAEMKTVAEYYAAIPRMPWIRVVESDTAPRTRVGVNGLFVPLAGNDTEPLGQRIVEVPENPELTERLRSPRSGFVAYVPVGSIARGEEIVTTGGGKTVACTICHGPSLHGMANVPGITDLPASYLVRQLYDVQVGARESPLMKPVVAQLDESDMIAIAAYLASK